MKYFKTVLPVILLAVAFVLGLWIGHGRNRDTQIVAGEGLFIDEKPSVTVSVEEVESEIKKIGELTTAAYYYTDAGRFEDATKIKDFIVPLTTKSFIVKWDGVIKAGIPLDKIEVKISEAEKEIVIYFPRAEILSHTIDNNSFQTLDEKDNIFNSIKVEDVNTLVGASKTYMESKIIRAGFLNEARANAEAVIRDALNSNTLIRENYSIVIEDAPEK